MGAMIRKYAPEGAGIDECDFEPLPIEIFDKTLGQTRKVLDFPCDERLGDAAMKVQTDVYVGRGVIGSADEWNNQLDRIALLRERYKTAVEDMESAAPAELFAWRMAYRFWESALSPTRSLRERALRKR